MNGHSFQPASIKIDSVGSVRRVNQRRHTRLLEWLMKGVFLTLYLKKIFCQRVTCTSVISLSPPPVLTGAGAFPILGFSPPEDEGFRIGPQSALFLLSQKRYSPCITKKALFLCVGEGGSACVYQNRHTPSAYHTAKNTRTAKEASMKFLFIHNSFPAQFRHIIEFLVKDNHEIVFLSQYKREDISLKGVRLIPVPRNAGAEKGKSQSHKVSQELFYTGEAYGKKMLDLAQKGFIPDVVYAHPGWGGSLYVPDIFPDAAYIIYGEWFYTKGENYSFFSKEKKSPAAFAANRHRNLYQLDALKECDAVISPTAWQMSQYPVEYAAKFRMVHDGIDTDFFSPLPEKNNEQENTVQGLNLAAFPEIVTYATRGMEPYRGFPQFFRSIPRILAERPQCHVVIMANDEVHYSAPRADGKSWGEAMKEEVPVEMERVHFLKFDAYEEYRKVLRATTVHVYLTAPFILSWSLLEAMSCACLVVASATSPVREVVRENTNGFLTAFGKSDDIAKKVIYALEQYEHLEKIRKNARQTILDRFSLKKLLPVHLSIIMQAARQKKALL